MANAIVGYFALILLIVFVYAVLSENMRRKK